MKTTVWVWTAILSVLLCLTACGREPEEPVDNRPPLVITQEEADAQVPPLVAASHAVNLLFYGEGLPYDGAPDKEKTSLIASCYLPVSEDAPFHSIAEMKTAAEAVYSDAYLSGVYQAMFEGIIGSGKQTTAIPEPVDPTEETLDYVEDNTPIPTDGDSVISSLPPRYAMIGGVLKIDVFARSYQITGQKTVTAVRLAGATPDYVTVEADYTEEGGKSGTMKLNLRPAADGTWRLDTPTY